MTIYKSEIGDLGTVIDSNPTLVLLANDAASSISCAGLGKTVDLEAMQNGKASLLASWHQLWRDAGREQNIGNGGSCADTEHTRTLRLLRLGSNL